ARNRATRSPSDSFAMPRKIEMLDRPIIVTNDLQKLESACMPGPVARPQSAEHFADRSVLVASGDGNEHARRVIAERHRKVCLFPGGKPRGRKIGRTEPRDQMGREHLHRVDAIFPIRFDDLHQRRPPKRSQSQKTGTEGGARLALKLGRIATRKSESARYGPFARFGRLCKNKAIRCIEADGPQQLHLLGPPAIGSGSWTATTSGIPAHNKLAPEC